MKPLEVDEIIYYLVNRWGKKYDFRLFTRQNYLYFQMMWKFLEQESFHMSEIEYEKSLAEKMGAKIVSNVSKKTDFLVTGSQKPTTRKIEEAKNLNIKILTENEWNKIIN